MRNRGALVVAGALIVAALGTLALLALRPPAQVDRRAPSAVAKVSDISRTPHPVQVTMRRGEDRVLQREQSAFFPCITQTMGCPASVEVASVTVFLVRDEADVLHAFIGEDPRNGCALEWLPTARPEPQAPDVFHDVCHGSIYDRRGQRVGGPSPWNLNEIATTVRGDVIWVDPGRIVVGACPGCAR